jgi:hypothetical protein
MFGAMLVFLVGVRDPNASKVEPDASV